MYVLLYSMCFNWVSAAVLYRIVQYGVISLYYHYYNLQGKVEMELEIVTEKEAEEKPTAVARDEPNAYPKLDPPKLVYHNSHAYP